MIYFTKTKSHQQYHIPYHGKHWKNILEDTRGLSALGNERTEVLKNS